MKKAFVVFLSLALLFILSITSTLANTLQVRIKDITRLQNLKEVQVFGYGLVVGLNGTGDKRGATFTFQSIANMLQNMGIVINPEDLRVKNCAAVMVTSTLSAFDRPGSKVDVTVSSLGDASSLEGGTLLLTPLQGIDGEIYVLAQGPVSIGGFNVESGGTSFRKNHPTVGIIPEGGIVKKSPAAQIFQDKIELIVSQPDFTTAYRICEVINKEFSQKIATAIDASTVEVKIPSEMKNEKFVAFISHIQNLSVTPETVAKVVINERTGTVVVGSNVRILPVAVAHGNLFVTIKRKPIISQPPPLSEGKTVVEEEVEVETKEEVGRVTLVEGATVEELVRSLNTLGVTPRDMIAIFQALKEAGALQAELIIM